MTPSRSPAALLGPTALARLGVSSADDLRVVDTFPAPSEGVAHGRAARDLLLALATSGLWQPLGEGDRDIAMRHVEEPGFVAFYLEDVGEVLEGSAETGGGMAAFDTRDAVACVRTLDGGVLLATGGAVYRCEVAQVDPFAGLEIPEAQAPIPAFESVLWARVAQAEAWLQSAVAELASEGANIPSAASAGLLARLWTRPEHVIVAAIDLPRERVRTHMAAASEEQRANLERQAVSRAWTLADGLRELDGLTAAETTGAVRDLVEDRDSLQSVLRVLRLGGRGDALAHALRAVDALAGERSASLANVLPAIEDDPQRERWTAVAWQEPSAWWTGTS